MSTCQFRSCKKQPHIAYVIDGVTFYLCKEHYMLIQKRLNELKRKHGYASSTWLKAKTKRNRITQILADKDRIRKNLEIKK